MKTAVLMAYVFQSPCQPTVVSVTTDGAGTSATLVGQTFYCSYANEV